MMIIIKICALQQWLYFSTEYILVLMHTAGLTITEA